MPTAAELFAHIIRLDTEVPVPLGLADDRQLLRMSIDSDEIRAPVPDIKARPYLMPTLHLPLLEDSCWVHDPPTHCADGTYKSATRD